LINDVAIPALAGIDTRALRGVINARVADEINIEAGKEDLEENAGTLFRILDRIPDNQEREAAFSALYRVIHGTFRIAKSEIYPIDEMRHSDDLRALTMRGRPRHNTPERDRIRQSVIDGIEKQRKLPPVKELLYLVHGRRNMRADYRHWVPRELSNQSQWAKCRHPPLILRGWNQARSLRVPIRLSPPPCHSSPPASAQ
jgi:hypothetical protein